MYFFSLGALSPHSSFSEYTHQCISDGAVRWRHVDTIRYLDVNR